MGIPDMQALDASIRMFKKALELVTRVQEVPAREKEL